MKSPWLYLFLAMALASSRTVADPFSSNSIVVLQVGDGTAALGSTATPVFLQEFTTNGTPLQTITIPASGSSEMTLSGTASTDGELAMSSNGSLLTFAGYVAAAGAASPVSATAAAVNRAVGTVDGSGAFSRAAVSATACNGANARGAVSDGHNFWLCGDSSDTGDTNGGVWFSAGGAAPIQVRSGNLRAVNLFNSKLWCSAAAATGPYGIHSFAGIPTNADASSVIFDATSGTGNPSPNAFALNASSTLAYVADDRTTVTGGGIQRWTNNGSAWILDYTLSIGSTGTTNVVRQLAVDFSGAAPVIYATTSEASANRLVALTDTSSNAGTAFSVLATAPANTVFRGVEFSPVPKAVVPVEPALRVLFIGDSLLGISTTYANDIPATLNNLAGNLGVPFAYTKIANSGWELAQHATNVVSTNAIASGSYDLVVLQEKAQNPSLPSVRDTDTFPACRLLNGMITNHGEQTMFYETWGFIDGDTTAHCNSYDIPAEYENCDGALGSFLSMNIALRKAYASISTELKADISPAGLAWARVYAERPDLNLYILDDSLGDRHPNTYGAYLVACVFYSSIFGRSAEGSSYSGSIEPTNAAYLQRVAAEAVLTDPFAIDAYGFGSNHFYWASRWQNYTNPVGTTAGTTIISGASASPSPSVKIDANVGTVTNLLLGTMDLVYENAGEGRLYLAAGGALKVQNNLGVGVAGAGYIAQNGGALSVGGALTLAEQAGSIGRYTLSNGQLNATQILGGNGAAQFNFAGGQLGFQQFGSGARPLNLYAAAGALTLTNPATIYGNYTNGSNAVLSLQLAGNSNTLTVVGTAKLGGALQVAYASGFHPVKGQQFVLLSAGSLSGNFANVTLPAVETNGLGLVLSVTATSLVVTATDFAASLGSPAVTSNGMIQFTVAGSGGNYILQTSTNLVNWQPLQTNAPPFTFVITNIAAGDRRFYRAVYSK